MGWANVRRVLGGWCLCNCATAWSDEVVFNSHLSKEFSTCLHPYGMWLAVMGKLVLRSGDMVNANMATGEWKSRPASSRFSARRNAAVDISDRLPRQRTARLMFAIRPPVPSMQKNCSCGIKSPLSAGILCEQNLVELESRFSPRARRRRAGGLSRPSACIASFAHAAEPQLFKQLCCGVTTVISDCPLLRGRRPAPTVSRDFRRSISKGPLWKRGRADRQRRRLRRLFKKT